MQKLRYKMKIFKHRSLLTGVFVFMAINCTQQSHAMIRSAIINQRLQKLALPRQQLNNSPLMKRNSCSGSGDFNLEKAPVLVRAAAGILGGGAGFIAGTVTGWTTGFFFAFPCSALCEIAGCDDETAVEVGRKTETVGTLTGMTIGTIAGASIGGPAGVGACASLVAGALAVRAHSQYKTGKAAKQSRDL
jgi:hypothetical protein